VHTIAWHWQGPWPVKRQTISLDREDAPRQEKPQLSLLQAMSFHESRRGLDALTDLPSVSKGLWPWFWLLTLIVTVHCSSSHDTKSRDSSVGIALGYGLDDRVRYLAGARNFFSSPPRQERLWGPPSLYPMGTRGCFLGGKADGLWSWPLTSI
jgi:hypothetical protein